MSNMRAATFSLFACSFVAVLGRSATEPDKWHPGELRKVIPPQIPGCYFDRSHIGYDANVTSHYIITSLTGLSQSHIGWSPIVKKEGTYYLFGITFNNLSAHFNFTCTSNGTQEKDAKTHGTHTISWDEVFVRGNITKYDDSGPKNISILSVKLKGEKTNQSYGKDVTAPAGSCRPLTNDGLAKQIAQTVADRISAGLALDKPSCEKRNNIVTDSTDAPKVPTDQEDKWYPGKLYYMIPHQISGCYFDRSHIVYDANSTSNYTITSLTGLREPGIQWTLLVKKEGAYYLFGITFNNLSAHFNFTCTSNGTEEKDAKTHGTQTISWDEVSVRGNITEYDDSGPKNISIMSVKLTGEKPNQSYEKDVTAPTGSCRLLTTDGLAKQIAQTVADRISSGLPLYTPPCEKLDTIITDSTVTPEPPLYRTQNRDIVGLQPRIPNQIFGGNFVRIHIGKDGNETAHYIGTSLTGLSNRTLHYEQGIWRDGERKLLFQIEFHSLKAHFNFKCSSNGTHEKDEKTHGNHTISWDKVFVQGNMAMDYTSGPKNISIEFVDLRGRKPNQYYEQDVAAPTGSCLSLTNEGLAEQIAQTVADRVSVGLPLDTPPCEKYDNIVTDSTVGPKVLADQKEQPDLAGLRTRIPNQLYVGGFGRSYQDDNGTEFTRYNDMSLTGLRNYTLGLEKISENKGEVKWSFQIEFHNLSANFNLVCKSTHKRSTNAITQSSRTVSWDKVFVQGTLTMNVNSGPKNITLEPVKLTERSVFPLIEQDVPSPSGYCSPRIDQGLEKAVAERAADRIVTKLSSNPPF